MQRESARGIASTLLEQKKSKKTASTRLAPIKATEIKNKELITTSPMGGTLTEGKAASFSQQSMLEDKGYTSQTNFTPGQ